MRHRKARGRDDEKVVKPLGTLTLFGVNFEFVADVRVQVLVGLADSELERFSALNSD